MKKLMLACIGTLVFCTGCASSSAPVDTRNSTLTQGNVQLTIKPGETSKTEILEVFGAPNITTRDGSGREVWSYQRSATEAQATQSSEYWTVILTGQSRSAAGFSQTSRMITLIIKFDSNDVVEDFRSRESNF